MSGFLAPLDSGRALQILKELVCIDDVNATSVESILRRRYPAVFGHMELRRFEAGAILLELSGSGVTGPLIFTSHLDAPGKPDAELYDGGFPAQVPLCRAHAIALLEALEGLLKDGFRPCGDLLLCFSMDGLNGGEGARSVVRYLKKRGTDPCFVLDCGGYATQEGFRRFMPKNAPLALVGTADRGEILGSMSFEGREATRNMLRTGARIVRSPHTCRLSAPTETMLRSIGKYAHGIRGFIMRHPRMSFPLLKLLWAGRPAVKQFFWSERYVYDISAPGSPQNPAPVGGLRFVQTVLPGLTAQECRNALNRLTGRKAVIRYQQENPAPAPSRIEGDAWDALGTAIEIQFERARIVPCLSPGLNDGRFFSEISDRVYHFSPFLLTDSDAEKGTCTLNEESLQTAVQFFRSMLSV